MGMMKKSYNVEVIPIRMEYVIKGTVEDQDGNHMIRMEVEDTSDGVRIVHQQYMGGPLLCDDPKTADIMNRLHEMVEDSVAEYRGFQMSDVIVHPILKFEPNAPVRNGREPKIGG